MAINAGMHEFDFGRASLRFDGRGSIQVDWGRASIRSDFMQPSPSWYDAQGYRGPNPRRGDRVFVVPTKAETQRRWPQLTLIGQTARQQRLATPQFRSHARQFLTSSPVPRTLLHTQAPRAAPWAAQCTSRQPQTDRATHAHPAAPRPTQSTYSDSAHRPAPFRP